MPFNSDLCDGCPMQGRYQPVEAIGPDTARYIIISDVPSQGAAQEGRLMSKSQMRLIGSEMTRIGLTQDDFRFVPACHCAFDPNEHVNKEKTAAIKQCRQHIQAEIEANPAIEAIIPLGATAATQAFGRSTKITKVRGIATQSEEFNLPIFPLTSPAQVVAYPQNKPIFVADINSFARSIAAEFDAVATAGVQHGEYEIVTDLQFLIDAGDEVIGFDTETTGFRWYQSGCDVRTYNPILHKGSSVFKPRFQILTMQFTTQAGKGYMLVWDHPERPIPQQDKPRLRNQLRQLLCDENRIVVGQNLKYDNVALWMTEGIRFRIGGDTLLLATLHDENLPEKNLDVLTKIFVPEMAGYADVFNSEVDKGRLWEEPLSKLLGYGCGDSDAAYRLYHVLEEKVAADPKLWAHYVYITIPGLNAFAALETRGMEIDEDQALVEFKDFMRTHVETLRQDLLRAIPRDCKQSIVSNFLGKTNSKGQFVNKGKTAADALSFTRPEFLKEVLFTNPRGFKLVPKVFTKSTGKLNDATLREPSVSSKDHLPYFFDTCPFTMSLAEYVKDSKLLANSVINFEKKYVRGGKVRPLYHLHKTVTGRSSSDDPNGQNYPKRGPRAKAYREMFYAPEGYFVIEADLSQAELRIAACMSGDKTMIDIYRRNGDIHKATGAIVAGITPEAFELLDKAEQKELRQKAKAVNFGFLYGMGWRKFIGYAKTQYGVEFTDDEAKRIRVGFFKKYRSLVTWHERMREFAMEHKFVRSFSGRVRHLPMIDSPEEYIQQEAGRQAINSPVQEFGSSLGVMAQGRMNEELDPKYLQVVGFIHDAIVVYVKKEYLQWGMSTLKHYMQSNPIKERFGIDLKVPILADVSFGENLGAIHECEGFEIGKPYDFNKLVDKKTGELLIQVPKQKVPPNNGKLLRSAYTLPTDLEDENVAPVRTRTRMICAQVDEAVEKRIERSKKQMVINRRNRAVKQEEEKAVRAGYIRRVRPHTEAA